MRNWKLFGGAVVVLCAPALAGCSHTQTGNAAPTNPPTQQELAQQAAASQQAAAAQAAEKAQAGSHSPPQ